MSNPIEYVGQAISLFDRSIQLGKEIVRYLTPQHKEAAIALFKINDKLLQAFQNILDLYYEFERLDLKKTKESEAEFREFDIKFYKFRTGKDYDNIKLLCNDIGEIYRKELDGLVRKWFNQESDKFYLAKEHFDQASKVDQIVSGFIDEILEQLKKTVIDIKANYKDGQEKQKMFLGWTNSYLMKLEEQFNELRRLRREYLKLAKVTYSDIY